MAPTTAQYAHKPECLVFAASILLFRWFSSGFLSASSFVVTQLVSKARGIPRDLTAFDDPLPIHQLQ